MGRHITAVVSQSALQHNLIQVKRYAPHSKIIAMVKANAYGHGLVATARALADADAFGVASIEEALRLRTAGIQTPIVLMEGFFRAEELTLVQNYNLTLVVHHWPQVEALLQYSQPLQQPFNIWLKMNTGMNRLGMGAEVFCDAIGVCQDPKIKIIGYMTHFAQADEQENPATQMQYTQFFNIVQDLQGQKCLANSAGILAWPQSHADWVRPGLMLYGASPFAHTVGADFQLKPAMTLRSEIIAVRDIALHGAVGYGATWENVRNISKIAIVAMGYGDGYPWHAKNGTPVLVNGQRTGTVGRISMDMLAVDISDIGPVKVGDPVTLWGEGLPIEEVARHAGTIPYELFCRFTERVTVRVGD